MGHRLDRDDILRIARLAHLALTTDELDTLGRQVTDILAYAEQIREADTSGVPPTDHPLDSPPIWREDVVSPSLDRDAVLDGAPDAAAGLFKVPKVL